MCVHETLHKGFTYCEEHSCIECDENDHSVFQFELKLVGVNN